MSISTSNSNNLPPIPKGAGKGQLDGTSASQTLSLLSSKNSLQLAATPSSTIKASAEIAKTAAAPSLQQPAAPQPAKNIAPAMRPLDTNHLSTYAILSILMEMSSSIQKTSFLTNISQTFTSYLQEQKSVQEQLDAAKTALASGIIKGSASIVGGSIEAGGSFMKSPIQETTGGDSTTYRLPEVEEAENEMLGDGEDHILPQQTATERTIKTAKITRTVGKDWSTLGRGAGTLIQGVGEIASSITQSYADKNQALAKQWDSTANALKSIARNWETTQQNLQKLFESLNSIYTQIEQAKNETLRSGSNMS